VKLISLPFSCRAVLAHHPWLGLATDLGFPLQYFAPGFLKQQGLCKAAVNDRIRGRVAQRRSSTYDQLIGKSVRQNLR